MADYAVLTVDQGTDTIIQIEVIDSNKAPMDLTGYSAVAKFKRSYNSTDSNSFECSIDSPATSGLVNLTLDGYVTNAIKAGKYVYDVELKRGSITERILEGPLEISPSVTKSDVF